jgi:hypothetical protein
MSLSKLAVFVSVTLLSAGTVIAAGLPDAPPAPRDDAGPPHDMPESPLPGARIEARLAFITTALKLTDKQLPAWGPVADALRAQAKRRDAEILALRGARNGSHAQGVPSGNVDPIARLEDRQHALAAEADDLARLLAVLKPFYATLTPEQKDDAEEVLSFGPPFGAPPFGGPPPGGPGMPFLPPHGGPMPPFPPPFPHDFP